ncbi:Histidinol-phosphate aminotransferase 2 [Caloramator mitchellensis]|uniref:Histidinol-phosphate aminotransferase n=1 Tax=Caloramator mitchellensis TaxID=908809 RepID=A0A0R3JXN4_CALMK|nr:histidinol-phosphate transaminase [Caloramator mitchellensis]KRQ87101.1 Histidinol-phosphate aminotransferase 2 [Caloramator mitchellensis]
MKLRSAILQMKPYTAGKPISEVKRELGLDDIIKLASNENPLGCSENVTRVINELSTQVNLYPDASNFELKKELANQLNVNPNQIFLSTGSDSIIRAICSIFIEQDEESIMGEVSFQRYEDNTKLMGGKVVKIPMKNHGLDLERMVDSITDKTRILWFCTPNNPTGSMISKQELLSVIDRIPKDVIFVMDEAYYEYVDDENFPQTIPMLDKYPNMIILRTFSKAYGLAGLRVGYGIASEEIAKYINAVIGPFDVNLIAQNAALAALKDKDFLNRVVTLNREAREYFYSEFEKMGLEYIKSQANFVMVKINTDDKLIFNELLKKGVIVRPGYLFDMPGWLRVSTGTMEQNKRFISALKEVLA